MEPVPRRNQGLFVQLALLLGLLAIVFAMGTSAVACRPSPASASAAQIGLRVVTDKVVGPAAVEVTIRTAEGNPVQGAQVTLRGDMNHAGMKPVIVQMHDVGKGTYLADDFSFTMAGDWLLSVQAALPNGEKVDRTFDITGVSRG